MGRSLTMTWEETLAEASQFFAIPPPPQELVPAEMCAVPLLHSGVSTLV